MTDQPTPLSDQTTRDLAEWEAIEQALGFPGQMLSGSKTTPRGCEDHKIYWNACVFNQHGQHIWHGDLDITASEEKLYQLADSIGTVYVTPEQPWRFDGFHETKKLRHHRERMVEFQGRGKR